MSFICSRDENITASEKHCSSLFKYECIRRRGSVYTEHMSVVFTPVFKVLKVRALDPCTLPIPLFSVTTRGRHLDKTTRSVAGGICSALAWHENLFSLIVNAGVAWQEATWVLNRRRLEEARRLQGSRWDVWVGEWGSRAPNVVRLSTF